MSVLPAPGVVFEASTFAPRPAEWRGLARDQTRLLVAGPDGLVHTRFAHVADHLSAGDLVVANDSATVPGELDATLGTTAVVVHLGSELTDGTRVVEIRTAPDAARAVLDASAGDELAVTGADARLVLIDPWPSGRPESPTGVGNRLWRARVVGDLAAALRDGGRPIAYGYLDRRYPLSAYQSVFSTRPGSAEMASAARPFTPEVLERLWAKGVHLATVTLHCGLSSQEAGEAPGPEWFEVNAVAAAAINAARAAGRRVVAVGTTVTRALESSWSGEAVAATSGWTTRVVTPLDPPRVVDGLVTGWHDPQASHLLLVEAVAGRERAQLAYDAAAASGYLWHEFGDSALLLR